MFGKSTVQGHLAEVRVTVISGGDGHAAPPQQAHRLHQARRPARLRSDRGGAAACRRRPRWRCRATARRCSSPRSARARSACSTPRRCATNTFDPRQTSANYIPVSGGGPSGLVLDEANHRLFVATRFDNAVKVIDLTSKTETAARGDAQPRAGLGGRTAGRSSTTPRTTRATARPRARAATSSATSTTWRGTSATPTTWSSPTRSRSTSATR